MQCSLGEKRDRVLYSPRREKSHGRALNVMTQRTEPTGTWQALARPLVCRKCDKYWWGRLCASWHTFSFHLFRLPSLEKENQFGGGGMRCIKWAAYLLSPPPQNLASPPKTSPTRGNWVSLNFVDMFIRRSELQTHTHWVGPLWHDSYRISPGCMTRLTCALARRALLVLGAPPFATAPK